MQVFAIANHVFVNDEDTIARREEAVPRLFESSLAYEYDTRSQSDGQAHYLDPIVLATLIQSLYYVHISLFI